MECSVCFDTIHAIQHGKRVCTPKGSDAVVLKCTHAFHKKCIKRWYTQSIYGNTCPCCRADVKACHVSGLWLHLGLLYVYMRNHEDYYCLDEFNDGYIYYDNAHLLLFVLNVRMGMIHYCAHFLKCFKEMGRVLFKCM